MARVFTIGGLDKETGAPVRIRVSAWDEDGARAKAQSRRVAVSDVERGDSILLERPISTIAIGVSLGLVMCAILAIIVVLALPLMGNAMEFIRAPYAD